MNIFWLSCSRSEQLLKHPLFWYIFDYFFDVLILAHYILYTSFLGQSILYIYLLSCLCFCLLYLSFLCSTLCDNCFLFAYFMWFIYLIKCLISYIQSIFIQHSFYCSPYLIEAHFMIYQCYQLLYIKLFWFLILQRLQPPLWCLSSRYQRAGQGIYTVFTVSEIKTLQYSMYWKVSLHCVYVVSVFTLSFWSNTCKSFFFMRVFSTLFCFLSLNCKCF